MITLLALLVASSAAESPALLAPESETQSELADSWPQWRGPTRDGTATGAPWPDDLTHLERLWRTPLGRSYSGPIVAGNTVFVTETDEGTEATVALDRATGRTLWRSEWSGRGSVPFFAKKSGEWIRSTPVYADGALFVGGMEEVVRKLDAETGREIWSLDFPERFATPKPDFGFASSPMVDGPHLIVQAANSVVAVDRQSGATVWRALTTSGGMMTSGAFSSPVIATLGDVRQLLVQTREALYGLDPGTGTVFWEQPVPNFRGMNILTPLVIGDSVFTSSYRNGSYLFRLSRDGASWRVDTRWTYKSAGYMSSPVGANGSIYLHLGNRRLTCLDITTGQSCWTSTPFGEYWSLVRQADKLLALDADGELLLIGADPSELRVLDRREIADQSTWGHLAIAGTQLFVRELEALTAYSWQAPAAAPPPAGSQLEDNTHR